MYFFNMNNFFLKIPVEIPKQPSPKKKRKSLLNSIGGVWYVKILCQKLPPLNKRRLIKKKQKRRME